MVYKLLSIFCLFCLLSAGGALAQNSAPPAPDRIDVIRGRLNDLMVTVPGLARKTEISVSGGTLQEFLKALAQNNNLNINIDPSLTQRINYHFVDETAADILLYLVKTNDLDINFFGNILSVTAYRDPMAGRPPPPREIDIRYDTAKALLTLDLHDDTLLNVARRITQLTDENLVVLPGAFGKKVTGY